MLSENTIKKPYIIVLFLSRTIEICMQKSISKDELDFSNDDSIYKIAECFSERTGKKKYFTYTCTTSSFPHSHLHKKVSINGKSYVIGYTIVFSPRIFDSKPKIVNWKASIFDIEAAKS